MHPGEVYGLWPGCPTGKKRHNQSKPTTTLTGMGLIVEVNQSHLKSQLEGEMGHWYSL